MLINSGPNMYLFHGSLNEFIESIKRDSRYGHVLVVDINKDLPPLKGINVIHNRKTASRTQTILLTSYYKFLYDLSFYPVKNFYAPSLKGYSGNTKRVRFVTTEELTELCTKYYVSFRTKRSSIYK